MNSVKTLIRVFLFIAVFGLAEQLSAQFDYVGRHRGQVLNVVLDDGQNKEDIHLMRLEGAEIVYRRSSQREGEIARPVEGIRDFIFQVPKPFQDAFQKLRDGRTEEGLGDMRPFVYGLFPYQELPSSNLFPLLNTYFGLLIQMNQLDEAVYFIRNVELARATPDFLNATLQFTQKLMGENRRTDAVAILNRLPFNKANIDLLEVVFNYAHDLRRRENYIESNFLYNRLIAVEDHPFREWAILWHAYNDVALNRPAAARLFINQYLAEPPESSAPSFSLYQLIIGKLHWISEEQEQAIMEITRGVVFASLDSEWTAELFYFNGQCYEKIEQMNSAREIYNTIRLFYPNSVWADRSYERISAIAPGFLEQQQRQEDTDNTENNEG